jgi:predicted nuclease with TOPRIM domain
MEFENEIRLRASLRKAVGEQEADTLMEKLTSIEEVRAEMHMEFAMVSARFTEVDSRFNQVDARFNQVDARFNKVDERFNQVDKHFVTLEKQMLTMEKKLIKWLASFTVSLFVAIISLIVTAFLTL